MTVYLHDIIKGEVMVRKLSEATNRKKMKLNIPFVVIFITACALLFGVYKAMIPTEYIIFTENRVNELEREYNMDLHGAELKRYWVPAMAQDTYDRFSFSVEDYSEFMENNFFGEIVRFDENNDGYAEYKCKPCSNTDDPENRFTFTICFRKNRENFDAELVSYYE